MILNIFWFLLLIISGIIMVKAAEMLINALTKISRFLGFSEFVISFILMAAATSLPEFFVGINAALDNNSVLTLGNIIGSNIVDITLIIGISILIIKNIRIKSVIAKKDSLYMFLLGTLPLVLLIDNSLSRVDGIVLLLFYILYISHLLKQKREFSQKLKGINTKEAFLSLIYFLIGLAILLFSSKLILFAAEKIAVSMNLSMSLIGLILVALGTSLPELIFETKAISRFHSELVLGDVMGSVVTNTTLILGTTVIISPIELQTPSIFYTSAIFLVISLFLFNYFLRTERKLETAEGIILILTYILFIIAEFTISLIKI